MSSNGQEIESKFYVRSLERVKDQLEALGAICTNPRIFEYNLRFDDRQKSLERQNKVLRLRKSDDIRMTFKGPGERRGGSISRAEIELVVNDFDTAKQLVESLGYRVSAVYEKYRAMYSFEGAIVTLDELPYGNFVEIEGENPEAIAVIARKLGLKTEASIPTSYLGLFEQLKMVKDLDGKNLTFWELSGLQATPEDLGFFPAD
jgi:adenylate cyclase class 2